MTEEVWLSGGVANAGAVSRVGDVVYRPATEFTPLVQEASPRPSRGRFSGVPAPLEPADDGRERLSFIPGEVASAPYPEWVQSDDVLRSLAVLMREFHETAAGASTRGLWNRDMADPDAAVEIVCHNDVCLENVVFLRRVCCCVARLGVRCTGAPHL